MQKWEYMRKEIGDWDGYTEFGAFQQSHFEWLGRTNWEMFAVTESHFYFKRPLN